MLPADVVSALLLVAPVGGVWWILFALESWETVGIPLISCRLCYHVFVHNKYINHNFLSQLSEGATFEDVCPLLDLMGGTSNYTQHVRVQTDLQLTTRNLPEEVKPKF